MKFSSNRDRKERRVSGVESLYFLMKKNTML